MRILFLVNDTMSPPGVLLEEARARGADCDVRLIHYGFGDPSLPLDEVPEGHEAHDALVIMGGPMGVYEADKYPFIDKTKALICSFHEADKSVMGVCLGSQLVASAFGGNVYKMKDFDEFGFLPQTWLDAATEDALLHDAEPELPIVQWHHDTFDLPDGAVQLSTRPICRNQSFRIGNKTYAFQFHLELTRETLEEWMAQRATYTGVELAEIEAAIGPIEAVLDPQQAFARRVMARWMGLQAPPTAASEIHATGQGAIDHHVDAGGEGGGGA
ncbi:type 1 glutamine amidotransferase [Parvibaculum sedimenti]|nr:type 1 glutamine amidotransferase [Parvibaculum sedimenti]